jgi:hypothetical protein
MRAHITSKENPGAISLATGAERTFGNVFIIKFHEFAQA